MTHSAAAEIDRAAEMLRAGALVAFPTETVYGLGADAANPAAVARIFAAKGRPQDHPVIVHIPGIEHLGRWAREVPEAANRLAHEFWPGPLTLVLRRAAGVCDAVTGGQDTVGLRVPHHPVAQALLAAFGRDDDGRRRIGIAAPSANKFGRISPTSSAHVRAELGGEVDLVLEGGACEVGIESTIVDCSGGAPVLLRPGRITAEDIARVAGTAPLAADAGAPRASGTLEVHYAPRHALLLVDRERWDTALAADSRRRAVMALRDPAAADASAQWIRMPREPVHYARDLYATLRRLDACDCDIIVVESPPQGAQWDGIRDRLKRAAARG